MLPVFSCITLFLQTNIVGVKSVRCMSVLCCVSYSEGCTTLGLLWLVAGLQFGMILAPFIGLTGISPVRKLANMCSSGNNVLIIKMYFFLGRMNAE